MACAPMLTGSMPRSPRTSRMWTERLRRRHGQMEDAVEGQAGHLEPVAALAEHRSERVCR